MERRAGGRGRGGAWIGSGEGRRRGRGCRYSRRCGEQGEDQSPGGSGPDKGRSLLRRCGRDEVHRRTASPGRSVRAHSSGVVHPVGHTEGAPSAGGSPSISASSQGPRFAPLILVALGTVLLLRDLDVLPEGFSVGPVVLIAVGVAVLLAALPVAEGAIPSTTESIPLEGATSARVALRHGAGRLTVVPQS